MDPVIALILIMGAAIASFVVGAWLREKTLRSQAAADLAKLRRDPDALEEHAAHFAAAADDVRARRKASR